MIFVFFQDYLLIYLAFQIQEMMFVGYSNIFSKFYLDVFSRHVLQCPPRRPKRYNTNIDCDYWILTSVLNLALFLLADWWNRKCSNTGYK